MESKNLTKPFLKWAGGKSQLLNEISYYYPFNNKINKYAEPFVGGGAVLFDVLNKFDLESVYISDINAELINTYQIIKDDVNSLVALLKYMQDEYCSKKYDVQKDYYLEMRKRFNYLKVNGNKKINIEKAALMIFLNKTCFNGLFRVNRKGEFNVPMGKYKNPKICNEENLRAISSKLNNVEIVCGDYTESEDFIDSNTFVYFDPPYRPLTETASFTSYAEGMFNDQNQLELAAYVTRLNEKGAKLVVSNSDPKNIDTNDNFFDEIYSSQNIKRITAKRMINCNGERRGKVRELLISNY